MSWRPKSGGGGGPSSPAKVSATGVGLGAGTDGALGIIRVGVWPNVHEELLRYNLSQARWVGDEITLISMSDQYGMNLDYRSGGNATNVDTFLLSSVPYGKRYTTLNGAQDVTGFAGAGVLTVNGGTGPFDTVGSVRVGDNLIAYTAKTANTFTGCTLTSGSGGSQIDGSNVTQGDVGGFGVQSRPLPYVDLLWAAGLRLQENLTAMMNAGVGNHVLSVRPYWYQYNNGDASVALANPPVGGVGFSGALASPASEATAKPAERPFALETSDWVDWAAGVPTKRYLLPRLFGKMDAAAVDTGEIVDATLRVRWIF